MTAQPHVGELHGTLVDALGAGIVSGQLAPGQVLTLEAVSAEHERILLIMVTGGMLTLRWRRVFDRAQRTSGNRLDHSASTKAGLS